MSSSNEKTSNVYKVLNTLCKAGNVLFICSLLFEGILYSRFFNDEEQFLVRWRGNYKPSWEPAEVIKGDCVQPWWRTFWK